MSHIHQVAACDLMSVTVLGARPQVRHDLLMTSNISVANGLLPVEVFCVARFIILNKYDFRSYMWVYVRACVCLYVCLRVCVFSLSN